MKNLSKKLEQIAKNHGIETLETRNSDSLDFKDIAVWDIKSMLKDAYDLGLNAK